MCVFKFLLRRSQFLVSIREISTVSDHLYDCHMHHPIAQSDALYCKGDEGSAVFVLFSLLSFTSFIMMNRKIAVGMLRQGQIGSQVLDILNVVVDDIRDSICEAEGIANCPENEDEIRAKMILV